MPKMEPFLYANGGPIIMVQVENEYGSYGCDTNYKNWIRDETEKYVNRKAVLFTNDGPDQVRCGKIDDVFATLDFGACTFCIVKFFDRNDMILFIKLMLPMRTGIS